MGRIASTTAMLAAGLYAGSGVARAQDIPATAGGDVTAEEATPLPPITVISPKEPIAKRRVVKKAAPVARARKLRQRDLHHPVDDRRPARPDPVHLHFAL